MGKHIVKVESVTRIPQIQIYLEASGLVEPVFGEFRLIFQQEKAAQHIFHLHKGIVLYASDLPSSNASPSERGATGEHGLHVGCLGSRPTRET